ncbi:MAG TPA: hypothetical protein VJH95_00225, partial [Candidatus Nanoarchaeia archaeon]|nr:hypothetical protein [Candidatus Nanoarchaeia archaeon]
EKFFLMDFSENEGWHWFDVIEPGRMNPEGSFILRKGNSEEWGEVECGRSGMHGDNVYACSLFLGKEINGLGNYSIQFVVSNLDDDGRINEESLSKIYNFEVVDNPTCVNINDELGIKAESNAVKVAFYADNYDGFDVFKKEAVRVIKGMFDNYETYNKYKNKFDFYLSDYVEKDSCETFEASFGTSLECDEMYDTLFYKRSCKEDVGVQFSNRFFRSNSGITLSMMDGRDDYLLAHELGHNPIGLLDEYCENKRYTGPSPYPNSFETLDECEEYSGTHLGGRSCEPICMGNGGLVLIDVDSASEDNMENGFVMGHIGPVMMDSGGEFSLTEQMRVNWFFDCCTPSSCSNLPKYCFSNICGSCPSEEYTGYVEIAPCSEVVCAGWNQVDVDEDGVSKELDCRDNDYVFHPGEPRVKFLESERRLSESCDNTDYNCDNELKQECTFTPRCDNEYRFSCINEHDYIGESAETGESCCGGCNGELGEFKIDYEASCGEGVCRGDDDRKGGWCDYPDVPNYGLKMIIRADFNKDGVIDLTDYATFSSVYGTMEGDINGDGVGDYADFLLLAEMLENNASYNVTASYDVTKTTLFPANETASQKDYTLEMIKRADFIKNGVIDASDFVEFQSNYFGKAGGDINGDGTSDFADFVLLSKMINEGAKYE